MAYDPLQLASGPNAESYAPTYLVVGGPVKTKSDTVVSGQGVIAVGQVLARNTSTGKLVKHDPAGSTGTNIAVAIAATSVDATSGDKVLSTYVAGEFAISGMTFNAATNTDALKLAVFGDESPIILRNLSYSGT